jgi:tRNA(Ile)-lysidine synthase
LRQNLKRQDFDHRLWKILKAQHLEKKKILVALSGGVDSVALLVSLKKLNLKVGAAYVHHGKAKSEAQQKYRDQAEIFCQNLCQKLDVEFFSLKIKKKSSSEAALRDQRYGALHAYLIEKDFDVLALAHHRDDLLETRLLRLIRGTGAQGLAAMQVFESPLFRPLLGFFKLDLETYLKSEKLRFLKDPSNASIDPLRNWLRDKWLKPLAKKQKGSLVSLARSLETLASEVSSVEKPDLLLRNEAFSSQDLSRAFYLSLNPTEQSRLLAQYLLSRGKKDFSQSHLQEIRKRLDKSQKELIFRVASCDWHINAEQIKVGN